MPWMSLFCELANESRMVHSLKGLGLSLQCSQLGTCRQSGRKFSGSIFGRFSAKLGPQTPLDRRGSSCSAGCTKNQPGRPILRPFRGARPDCLQVPRSSEFLGFLGDLKSPILGRFPAQPARGGRPRQGPRWICTDFQPGRPILRPFREVC